MFKRILIPISSEYYPKEVIMQGVFLAEKLQGSVTLLYIIEEKTLNQADKSSDIYRTSYERSVSKHEIIKEHMQAADSVVFEEARHFFEKSKIPLKGCIIEGEFSTIVQNEVRNCPYDLILMGFEKECVLNYRLFDGLDVEVPMWVVSKNDGDDAVLAVCSNLAPNEKVPEVSAELSKILGWKLHMLYVVDIVDSVEVDTNLDRSGKKSEEELMNKGYEFVERMKTLGIKTQLVKGSLEKELIKAGESLSVKLIIVGRAQKRKGTLGLPKRHIKLKIVEKCPRSILFVN